jgi:hypothetical protein
MRHQILAAIIGCALLVPGASSGQQRLDPELPGRTVVAGLGVRDAGDLATVWVAALGVRFPVTQRVNAGLTAWGSDVPELQCPQEVGFRCPTGGGTLTGLDLGLEFYYGRGVVHPYGVISVGAGHLSLPDEDVRETAFSYSTGLGLGARAGRRVWLLGEGRWRHESFGPYRAHGVMGVLGVKWGF